MKLYSAIYRLRKCSFNPHVHSMANIIPVTNFEAEAIAVKFLKSGLVIAVPTDTVYGLACDATNIQSINKLYAIKCRNENKPVAVCLSSVSDVQNWAYVNHLPQGLLDALLPGPVTLILNCANKLDNSLTFQGKVGIRIPDYNFIRNLVAGLERPVALTSANLSSETSSLSIIEFKAIWDRIPAIFDGGILGLNHSASTVADLSENNLYSIVRKGVAFDNTKEILKKFSLKN